MLRLLELSYNDAHFGFSGLPALFMRVINDDIKGLKQGSTQALLGLSMSPPISLLPEVLLLPNISDFWHAGVHNVSAKLIKPSTHSTVEFDIRASVSLVMFFIATQSSALIGPRRKPLPGITCAKISLAIAGALIIMSRVWSMPFLTSHGKLAWAPQTATKRRTERIMALRVLALRVLNRPTRYFKHSEPSL